MALSPEPLRPSGASTLLRPDQAAELLSVKGELVRRGLVAPQSDLGVVVVGRDPTFTGAVAIGDSVSPQRGARFLGRMRHAVCGAVDAGDMPRAAW
jgi:hypothetical protein